VSQPSFDPEAIAMSMLTLRVSTPGGTWLGADDERTFNDLWQETVTHDRTYDVAVELMNLAWYALINLWVVTGRDMRAHLAELAADVRGAGDDDLP